MHHIIESALTKIEKEINDNTNSNTPSSTRIGLV
jgi:hypothetical protein